MMQPVDSNSDFAPSYRQRQEIIEEQHKSFCLHPLLQEIFNSLPYASILLNQERQVVFSNSTLLHMLGISGKDDYLGQRPGEMFHCIHSERNPSGCGSSRHCRLCGCIQVVLASQQENKKVSGECRITAFMNGDEIPFDLMVSSTPIDIGEYRFYIVNLIDISHEKRRRLLERVFFHDITNSAGNILIVSELALKKPEKRDKMLPLLLTASEQLIEDINAQKKLLDAENNDLVLKVENISSFECLQFTALVYREYAKERNVQVVLDPGSEDVAFESDRSIVLRVLGNVMKNALEAAASGDAVKTGCRIQNDSVSFWCTNPQSMPEDTRMQIFQRSFTTKGAGRGLGTYTIKLFTEKYLKGKVSFISSEPEGTTFIVTLPLSFK